MRRRFHRLDVFLFVLDAFWINPARPPSQDLLQVPGGKILLSVRFPSSFPTAPPYVRVIRPRFVFRTGHVTIGGSICTEMLTNQGYRARNRTEAPKIGRITTAPLTIRLYRLTSTMTMESMLLYIRTNLRTNRPTKQNRA